MKILKNIIFFTFLSTLLLSTGLYAQVGAINSSLIEKLENNFKSQKDHTYSINTITNNNIKDLSLNRSKVLEHNDIFTFKLEGTDIINQKSSGRCWIFAGVNVFAPKIMTKLQLSDFEISESYLAFYDKLEKANSFLERIIELRDKPLDNRSLRGEMEYLFGDGGWWNYMLSLMDKYGIVPISAMPETKQSNKTGQLNSLGKTLLRKFAAELRQMHKDGKKEKDLRERKEAMLEDIYKLLVYNYGIPPKEFTFRYEAKPEEDDSTDGSLPFDEEADTTETDTTAADTITVDTTENSSEKDKEIIEKTFTPLGFYQEYFGDNLAEYVAIVNNPAKKYNTLYKLEGTRNIHEQADLNVLNMPIAHLKNYSQQSLYDSQSVWFAMDVGKENYRDSAIMALNIYDYNLTFGIDFKMTKKERIEYSDIAPSHAMVITGIDTALDGSTTKWLVENSWGAEVGDKGYWYMYDSWFDEYVLLVIIDKALLSDDDKKLFDQKPEIIEDWEPFFLALRNLK